MRLVKVHDKGDVAIVHGVLSGTYPLETMATEGGDLRFLITDVWIKRGAAWQVLSRHVSRADR